MILIPQSTALLAALRRVTLRSPMKLLLALMLTASALLAQTTNEVARELQFPKRVVSGTTVDVSPLMRWHMGGSQGARPLKPWEWIIGTPVATNSMGWAMSAIVGTNPVPITIVLRNPPKSQQDEFNRLKSQYAGLVNRQAQVAASYQRALDYYRDVEAEFRRLQLFRFAGDAMDIAYADAEAARANAEVVVVQLKNFDWLGHDPNRGFVFKGYAVRTGLLFNKAPVFDYGTPLR